MDATLGSDTQPLDKVHFASRRKVEEPAFLEHSANHRGVRHRFQRIVQVDSGKRLAQLSVLHAHTLAIEYEQRGAELSDEAPDFCWLKRIYVACAASPTFHFIFR
jgi:hypothetical protein